jgi:hypothetical protein
VGQAAEAGDADPEFELCYRIRSGYLAVCIKRHCRAKDIGVTIGKISHPDIVDVHVALAAAERGHAVLTADDADIAAVDLDLVLLPVITISAAAG